MPEQANTPDDDRLPVITREGDRVSMSVQDWDDIVARLLVAEGHVDRSWLPS